MAVFPNKQPCFEQFMITAKSAFFVQRASKTVSAAKQIAGVWTWEELTPAEMQTMLETVTGNSSVSPPVAGQMEIESRAQRARDNAHGTWLTMLGVLHQRTVSSLNLAKNKFRDDATSLAVLHGMVAGGHSPDKILAEALAWESAWGKLAPAWSPDTTNTLTAFKALRKQCAEDLQTAFSDADSVFSEAHAKLEQMCGDLEDMSVAWYAAATLSLDGSTPEGQMIRTTIPTTYTPPPPKPAPAPATKPAPGTTP